MPSGAIPLAKSATFLSTRNWLSTPAAPELSGTPDLIRPSSRRQRHLPRARRHGFRRPLREDPPAVIGSGLAGGVQPGGCVTRCLLVPRPIAPGC